MDAADVQPVMSKPTVSVVMVVCNVDRFLAEAIESILGQTFREFEFIIVDFGSTDKSKEIVSRYAAKDARVRLHEIPLCGLGEARNAACFLARGKYIAIMDADDVSITERLMWEVEFLEKHPEVGVVGGAVDWIDASGACVTNSAVPPGVTLSRPEGNRELQLALLKDCPIWQPSVLMRREAFVLVGGYRPAFAPTEDYDLWLRISEHFEMANLKQVVLNYRIHPHQVSVRRRKQQTLGTLAALASAAARRSGNPDPLDSVKEITPAVLVEIGVSEAKQQTALAVEYRGWIYSLCGTGEWSGALNAAIEMVKSSDWKHIERRERADMHLEVARLYWKNHRFFRGIVTVGQAVITRPRVAGRPLGRLLRRLEVMRPNGAF
jgi:hypothetical protein